MTESGSGHKLSGNDTPARDLSPRQTALIVSLVSGGDIASACVDAGIARRTGHRWLKEPAFAAALRSAETEVLTATSRRLALLGARAVQVLSDVLDDPEAPPTVRVRAADAVLSRLLALRESVQLEERISAIEVMLAEREEHHGQKR